MADKDYDKNLNNDRFEHIQEHRVFEEDVVKEIESVQDPYPVSDEAEKDENEGTEVENPDTDERVHEYEDKDHPHEYRPPSAVIDDYQGSERTRGANKFEQQNPLQSTIPSSEQDEY